MLEAEQDKILVWKKKSYCLWHMKLWEATECHLVATRGNALRGSGSGGQSSTAEVSLGSGQVSDTGWKSLLFLKK